jgi:hypothetical protein
MIKDEVDFRLDVKYSLLPESITLDEFAVFIKKFRDIGDDSVSPRFSYGQLRLSKLNLLAPFVLRRFEYINTTRQSDMYFSSYF